MIILIWIVYMCISIGQQVCFHNTMKHVNDESDMIGRVEVVKMDSFMKEIKLVYIIMCFVYCLSLC